MLRLRDATKEDRSLLFEWANDPEVRRSSFSPQPIEWERHVAWFEKKLRNPSCFIFIASDEQGVPVGQVRFELQDDGSVAIDLHTARESRGKGYGTSLIAESLIRLFARTDVFTVHAYVKAENRSSVRAFAKAGFRTQAQIEMKGHAVHHDIFQRSWLQGMLTTAGGGKQLNS